MHVLILLLNIFLTYFLAFQAGQMWTMIKLDKEEDIKPDWKLYFFLVADSLISLYIIVSIYGAGLKHGNV